MGQQVAALEALLAPVVTGHGVDLETVSVSKAGSRSVVRVVVDRDGGLDLDAVAVVSQAVSAVLDADDEVIRGSFVLEVSTPGVDRPLTEVRHWRRARGRLVKVTRRSGSPLVARVAGVADDAVELTDPDSGVVTRLALADISRAVMQVEFNGPGAHGTPESSADESAQAS